MILVVGGIGIVALLLFSKSGSGISIPGLTPAPVSTTTGEITAATSGATSLTNAFANLFNGGTAAPLTSGASPANPNNTQPVPGGAGTSTDALGSDFFSQFD